MRQSWFKCRINFTCRLRLRHLNLPIIRLAVSYLCILLQVQDDGWIHGERSFGAHLKLRHACTVRVLYAVCAFSPKFGRRMHFLANPKDAISCILWYRYIYYKISTASDRFALKERKPSNAGRILLPILLVVVVVVAVVAVEYL
jgi:hypothetical protein